MTDSMLDPQSDQAHRLQRDAERLTEWVAKKVAELEAAYATQDSSVRHAEALLDVALYGEWDDECPLAEDDPRWLDVKRAWDKADKWDVSEAVRILEAL